MTAQRVTAATLFSGIGAPECAMPHWQWPWHAEIDKFPSAVMAARHPHSINLGDVSADDFAERAGRIARPDVLVFGSPCQSYSIAGKRLGLDDPRGNLALIALGIVARLKPRWFVFENVPGLFSSWSGEAEGPLQEGAEWDSEESSDFITFLSLVDELRYSGAWAVLDAQYRGVAQRRDRVFFVGHSGDWRAPAAILLEPESLCGNYPPRRQAGKDIAGTLSARTEGGGGLGTDFDLGGVVEVAMCLNAGAQGRQDAESETLIPIRHGGFFNEVAPPLTSNPYGDHESREGLLVAHALRGEGFDASEDGTGRGTPIVAFQCQGNNVGEMGTIRKGNGNVTGGVPFIAFDCKSSGRNGFGVGEIASTMRAMNHADSHPNAGGHLAVAFDMRGRDGGSQFEGPHDTANIRSGSGGSSRSYVASSAVRRLTPRECERLQGFPDDYTLITYRGKPAADGPRYKALGNSMAVPVVRWILNRIEIFETRPK